jgi:hypothetical protein
MQILNRDYVLEPFHSLMSACQNNVLLGLRLIEKLEVFPGPTDEEIQFFQMPFVGRPDVLCQSKSRFKRWILLNGLGDVNQCIGTMLRRFITLKTIEGEMKQNLNLNIEVREAELRAQLRGLNTPKVIERTNQLCPEPLSLQKEIESFNNARNCLEHAMGTVTKRFCNSPQKDKLIISGRRFKLFFAKREEEIPALIGKPGPENAALMLGAESFEIQFAPDESVELSLKQFLDVLNTCVFVRADIDLKLAV